MGDMTDCHNCGAPAYRFKLCLKCGKDPTYKDREVPW